MVKEELIHTLKKIGLLLIDMLRVLLLLIFSVLQVLFVIVKRLVFFLYNNRKAILEYRYSFTIAVVLFATLALWNVYHLFINKPHSEELNNGDYRNYKFVVNETSDTIFFTGNQRLINTVYDWLGTPYRGGGTSRRGTDCSNFVHQVYKDVYGINLERNSAQIYQQNITVVPTSNLQEGDLLFFNTSGNGISHVGLYLRSDLFVHASSSKGVIITSLQDQYYQDHFVAAGRVKQ